MTRSVRVDRKRLKGHAGLVTGASGGLGRATAVALAQQGADVLVCGRNADGLRETVERAAGASGRMVVMVMDPSIESDVRSAVSLVESTFGTLTFVVNNAGTQIERSLLETTTEDWEYLERVNVHSAFWGSKYAVAAMVRLGVAGSVVNVASTLSVAGDPMLPAYTASKHAVLGLSRAIATTRDYARIGIRANAVCPGDMETPMFLQYLSAHDDAEQARASLAAMYPIERIAAPEEVASVIAFLVSDESSYVNGTALVVDGGLTAVLYTNG